MELHASSAICVSSYHYIRVSSSYYMVQRLAEKEEMELHAARERIASLKKGNARHLEQMRRDLCNPRHPLFKYGDRCSKACQQLAKHVSS